MLYYLFTWLDKHYDIPGAGLFQFISFRTAMAVILSLLLTTVYGGRLIRIGDGCNQRPRRDLPR